LDEAKNTMIAAGVPAAQVVRNEKHEVAEMRSRPRFFEEVAHPVVGLYEQMTWPAEFSRWRGPWLGRHAPLFGEHNHQILSELNLTEEEIAHLEKHQIISQEPIV
jgi:crotonobetainyl-CoA:carnitine CoA-transferase CaiB-like acyl-CoA transferase